MFTVRVNGVHDEVDAITSLEAAQRATGTSTPGELAEYLAVGEKEAHVIGDDGRETYYWSEHDDSGIVLGEFKGNKRSVLGRSIQSYFITGSYSMSSEADRINRLRQIADLLSYFRGDDARVIVSSMVFVKPDWYDDDANEIVIELLQGIINENRLVGTHEKPKY